MSQHRQTVTINGMEYDKHTGMPLGAAAHSETAVSVPHERSAQKVHVRVERSHRLNRTYAKPHSKTTIAVTDTPAPASAPTPVNIHAEEKRLPTITKFALPVPAQTTSDHASTSRPPIAPPSVHPMVQRVHAAHAERTAEKVPKPAATLKQEAVSHALSSSVQPQAKPHTRQRAKQKLSREISPRQRITALAAAGFAVALIGGYLTYISMPALSVKVAAAQAGMDASYPAYRPSGYRIAGPVAYDNGSVSMRFAQNGGGGSFLLKQTASGWDSDAVLDNYVAPQVGEDYLTTKDSGLTIYTFGNKAAWVSGGILYTIEGDALLSPSQVSRIATSM